MGGRRREKEGEGRGAGGIVGGKEEGEREGEEGHGGRSEDLGSVQVEGRAVVFGWHALPSCAVPLSQCASVPVCECQGEAGRFPRLHYRLLTLCPAPTDPVGQSWPRGTG